VLALSRPGVNGVLGTPDNPRTCCLLGALEGQVVVGSMNRGGLGWPCRCRDGDRFTAYGRGPWRHGLRGREDD